MSMYLPSITIAEPSPEMLRAIAAVMEQESVVVHLNRRSVMEKIIDGLNDSETPDPEILPAKKPEVIVVEPSTTQDNPMGNEGTAFAAPAKKRGRPPKNAVVAEPGYSGQPESQNATAPEPTIPAVPVNPVVTMPNGVVLNAPVETKVSENAVEIVGTAVASTVTSEPLVPAVVLGAYAKAFQIPALVALAQREGVQKFTELPEDRQQEVYAEMMQAVALGVPAA